MRSLLAVAVSVLSLASAQAAGVPSRPREPRIRETLDVRYYPGRDRHTLDVFSPDDKPGTPHPVVVFVHGGTWMVGDKNFHGVYRGVGQSLARQGIVAVLMNYRLSPMVRHPEHTKDIARAFAWTVKNVERYGGDPDRIILAGHSAGAHLAALLATDESYLKDPELKLDDRQRKAVRGMIGLCGVYRIPEPTEFRRMADRIVDNLVERKVNAAVAPYVKPTLKWASLTLNPFHLVFGTDAEVRTKASPISHVHRGLPPFLLFNSEYEVPGLWYMGEDFAKELQKNGVAVEHRQIEGCSHRSIVNLLHDANDAVTRDVVKFVQRYAGKPRGDRT